MRASGVEIFQGRPTGQVRHTPRPQIHAFWDSFDQLVPERQQLKTNPSKPSVIPQAVKNLAAKVPLQMVRLEGSKADVLLPATGDGDSVFSKYLDELERRDFFHEPKTTRGYPGVPVPNWKAFGRLRRLRATPIPNESEDPRPVVGILISDPKRLLPGNHRATNETIEDILALGCRPVLIPPCAHILLPGKDAQRWVGVVALANRLHAVVSPGGPDVHPRMYKQRNVRDPSDRRRRKPNLSGRNKRKGLCRYTNYPRDRFEGDMLLAAMGLGRYCFGTCRGAQLLNVLCGRPMYMDLKTQHRAFVNHDQEEPRELAPGIPEFEPIDRKHRFIRDTRYGVRFAHQLHLDPNSEMARDLGGETEFVSNGLHHQATDGREDHIFQRPKGGMRPWFRPLEIIGWVPDPVLKTKTVEASEGNNARTLQCHPEPRPKSVPEKKIFSVVGRRARIQKLLEDLQRSQTNVSVTDLIDGMKEHTLGTFLASDFEWVRKTKAEELS